MRKGDAGNGFAIPMLSKSTPGSDLNSPWFERLSPAAKPSLLLLCFPYAGGSAQIFRKWQRYFPSSIDICLVHLPGRGRRIGERPLTRLAPLVEAIADAIPEDIQQPFALFGHSLGALISFELSRELRRRNRKTPLQLFLSGRSAAHMSSSDAPTYNLPNDEFIAEIRRLNGTPQPLLDDPETQELFLPLLRADFEMADTYKYFPEDPLACPLTIYGGLQDTDVPIGNLRAWGSETSGSCKVRVFPGDHFFIHSSEAGFLNVLQQDVIDALRKLEQKPENASISARYDHKCQAG